MRITFYKIISTVAVLGLFTSCEEQGKGGNGPIVLGDSAYIVTETDSTYLQDMVLDYQPVAKKELQAPETPKVIDTPLQQQEPAKEEETVKEEEPKGKGLNIELRDFTLFIPNVAARGSNGTYMLTKGNLSNNKLQITNGTVEEVEQRYQTVVVAESSLGKLVLDNLSTLASWKPLKGNGKTYTISGISDRELAAPKFSSFTLRRAIQSAARKQRLSKAQTQKWLNSVSNVRRANQKPLSVELRSVMWKIDGKDAKGKPFNRQVRIDLPI